MYRHQKAYLSFASYVCRYHIAQNFGSRKLWWIWWSSTKPPKFYSPTILILQLFCYARQSIHQCFICQIAYCHQSFLLPMCCAIRYLLHTYISKQIEVVAELLASFIGYNFFCTVKFILALTAFCKSQMTTKSDFHNHIIDRLVGQKHRLKYKRMYSIYTPICS